MRSFNSLPNSDARIMIKLPRGKQAHDIYGKGESILRFDLCLLFVLIFDREKIEMFNSEEIQSSLDPISRGTDYETANYPPEHDCT